MPKLSEVLGGIVKDATQAQITSDLASLEYSEIYREHPLLKHLSVPRLKIKDLTCRLRFAVAKTDLDDGFSDGAKAAAGRMLQHHFRTKLMPEVLSTLAKNSSLDRDALKRIIDTVVGSAEIPEVKLDSVIENGSIENRRSFDTYLMSVIKLLPKEARREFPSLIEIKRTGRERYEEDIKDLQQKMKKVAVAKTAQDFDLEIAVSHDDLKGVDTGSIQEISFNISLEDNPLGEE